MTNSIDKIKCRKLKIEQHKLHQKLKENSGGPES